MFANAESPPRPGISGVKAAVTPDPTPDKPSGVVKQLCGRRRAERTSHSRGSLSDLPRALVDHKTCQYKKSDAIFLPLGVACCFFLRKVVSSDDKTMHSYIIAAKSGVLCGCILLFKDWSVDGMINVMSCGLKKKLQTI